MAPCRRLRAGFKLSCELTRVALSIAVRTAAMVEYERASPSGKCRGATMRRRKSQYRRSAWTRSIHDHRGTCRLARLPRGPGQAGREPACDRLGPVAAAHGDRAGELRPDHRPDTAVPGPHR